VVGFDSEELVEPVLHACARQEPTATGTCDSSATNRRNCARANICESSVS